MSSLDVRDIVGFLGSDSAHPHTPEHALNLNGQGYFQQYQYAPDWKQDPRPVDPAWQNQHQMARGIFVHPLLQFDQAPAGESLSAPAASNLPEVPGAEPALVTSMQASIEKMVAINQNLTRQLAVREQQLLHPQMQQPTPTPAQPQMATFDQIRQLGSSGEVDDQEDALSYRESDIGDDQVRQISVVEDSRSYQHSEGDDNIMHDDDDDDDDSYQHSEGMANQSYYDDAESYQPSDGMGVSYHGDDQSYQPSVDGGQSYHASNFNDAASYQGAEYSQQFINRARPVHSNFAPNSILPNRGPPGGFRGGGGGRGGAGRGFWSG
jgi:hypothetical protein